MSPASLKLLRIKAQFKLQRGGDGGMKLSLNIETLASLFPLPGHASGAGGISLM